MPLVLPCEVAERSQFDSVVAEQEAAGVHKLLLFAPQVPLLQV